LPESSKTFMELKKKTTVRPELTELVKQETKMKRMVLDAFRVEAHTVPEVAQALNLASHEAMHWVMALRKYGLLEDTQEVSDEGYYKYKLAQKKS
jgi:uridine kinase